MLATYAEMKAILSEKPSVALRHALDALDAFENTSNCEIDMSIYHSYNRTTNTCFACLGGAAALARFRVPRGDWQYLQGFTLVDRYFNNFVAVPEEAELGAEDLASNYEEALNMARIGRFEELFTLAGIPEDRAVRFNNRAVPEYADDPIAWRAQMEDFVRQFEAAGY